MDIRLEESVGIVGGTASFTNQELIAIKDKWIAIVKPLASGARSKHSEVRVNTKALLEMDKLMHKLVGNIPSSEDVHNTLFTDEDEVRSVGRIELPME